MGNCGYHEMPPVTRAWFGNDGVPLQYDYNLIIQQQQQQQMNPVVTTNNVTTAIITKIISTEKTPQKDGTKGIKGEDIGGADPILMECEPRDIYTYCDGDEGGTLHCNLYGPNWFNMDIICYTAW